MKMNKSEMMQADPMMQQQMATPPPNPLAAA